jgi:hypothetical protein
MSNYEDSNYLDYRPFCFTPEQDQRVLVGYRANKALQLPAPYSFAADVTLRDMVDFDNELPRTARLRWAHSIHQRASQGRDTSRHIVVQDPRNTIVGMGSMDVHHQNEDIMELYGFYVAQRVRKQRIGKSIIQLATQFLDLLPSKTIIIPEIEPTNTLSGYLLTHAGFKVDPSGMLYHGQPPEYEVW